MKRRHLVVVPPSVDDIENIVPDESYGSLKPDWTPNNWQIHIKNIRQMRANLDAPVDLMGCERLADKSKDPKTFRLQVLISLMLSSQTKDQVTAAAMARLQVEGCELSNIIKMPIKKLENLIYPVGFYRRKAAHIKMACEIMRDQHDSDIPNTFDGLCKLPGVGPKMAHLAMKCAWNQVTGIGVDTHVHRIANRLGWTKNKTKTPEETRNSLEAWLPREYWSEINWLLVGFGQQCCQPTKPNCKSCLNQAVCPFKSKSH